MLGETYFLTVCAEGKEPVLTRQGVPQLLIDSLRWIQQNGLADCYAYAIMPDHLHLMLKLRAPIELGDLIGRFKKFTARRINEELDRSGPVWEDGFWDHGIRNGDDYDTRMGYLWENPVRSGLVERPEDYLWSSVHGLPEAVAPDDPR